MMRLDTSQRYHVVLPTVDDVYLTIVGCGGTGSQLASNMARLAYHMAHSGGPTIHLQMVDMDTVGHENIGRQLFAPQEVGLFKSDVIAARLSAWLGLEVVSSSNPIAETNLTKRVNSNDSMRIIIGCVDNNQARHDIGEVAKKYKGWWVDCSNGRYSGRVLVGNDWGTDGVRVDPWGHVSCVPFPSVQEPDLADLSDVETDNNENCATLALAGDQSLFVNQTTANIASEIVRGMIETKRLERMGVEFSINPFFVSQDILLTQESIKKRCPVYSFVGDCDE